MQTAKQLALVKGEHRFVFRYTPGNEADVITAFADMASESEVDFDWFDAAVLSYQMGRRLEVELEELVQQGDGRSAG
jgi:hypothetical protein